MHQSKPPSAVTPQNPPHSSSSVSFPRFPFVAVSIGFSVSRQVSRLIPAALAFASERRRGPAALCLPPDGVWCRLQLPGRQDVHSKEGGGLLLQRRAAAGLCSDRSAGHARTGTTSHHTSNHKQLFLSAINQSIIATEFGSNREPEVVDRIFSSLRNILCIPVHGYGSVTHALLLTGQAAS